MKPVHDLIVDLSNACRDSRLGDSGKVADWNRLSQLIDVWRRDINADTDFYYVADNSLARYFRGKDRELWQKMETGGSFSQAPNADTEILRRAHQTGASVLSCDKFAAHRRSFPWVDDDQQHFWDWTSTNEQGVVIRRRSMGHFAAADLTRAEEESELKARGLRHGDELLSRVWCCRTYGCSYGDRPAVTRIPGSSGGRAMCPDCRQPLIDLGPRPKARRLKAVDGAGNLLGTMALGEEQVVTLGSRPGVNVWSLEGMQGYEYVSRQHARLEVRGGQVVVTDLGSTGGTRVANWNPSEMHWLPGVNVTGPTTLKARDRIELPGGLFIEQSGAKYVIPDLL